MYLCHDKTENPMGRKKKERFCVTLHCKPYVRAYLVRFFDRPDIDWAELIDIRSDKVFYDMFLRMLHHPNRRRDKILKGTAYTAEVRLEITYDDFRRYGWMLSPTDECQLNNLLEERVKQMLYAYVTGMRAIGMSTTDAIRGFQKRMGLHDSDWEMDSIRKDLQRNLPGDSSLFSEFLLKIEEKVWATVSQNTDNQNKKEKS